MSAIIHIIVMGGQHRWAPAYLAAYHHIYFIIYYMYISVSFLANKLVVVVLAAVETIGSKRSYALTWCMPNNDDDDGVVIGCEDRLRNDLYCVVKLCSSNPL